MADKPDFKKLAKDPRWDSVHGRFRGGDPNYFEQDKELSLPEEQDNHKRACEEWDPAESFGLDPQHDTLNPDDLGPYGSFGMGVTYSLRRTRRARILLKKYAYINRFSEVGPHVYEVYAPSVRDGEELNVTADITITHRGDLTYLAEVEPIKSHARPSEAEAMHDLGRQLVCLGNALIAATEHKTVVAEYRAELDAEHIAMVGVKDDAESD